MDLPTVASATPTLAEVTPSALAALGVAGFTDTLGFGQRSRVCVLLIDGLGWELLAAHASDAPVLSGLPGKPLCAGYPATTAAGLAAIGTGTASGEHGFVGYTFDLPGVGVLNALRWREHPGGGDLRERVSPAEVQRLPTTFARATEAGLTATVVSSEIFAGTPLTRAVLSGGSYVGVHALGDLVAAVPVALRSRGSFCYAYHGDLDRLGHLHGPGSVPWRMQLRQVDRLVESMIEQLPEGSALAVVADHGMTTLDRDTGSQGCVIDADTEPALADGVRAIAGEVRARHVYAESGAATDVLATWREMLGDRAWVMRRHEAVDAGWFGPVVADHVLPRIGDVVVAARGRSGVVRSVKEPQETALAGQHGSLTPEEQFVPFILAEV
ncbi:alkaline phosphatase family protein [Saccharomonospora xinjiangensis]|uniref:Putative AP superfamily protein n=1 Tax=Saccharomonospora xinjiangensis XJ-54 TaxID=882086 RepID=I0V5M6_9PSEU|nr:nucleotide pyrophosphatase/phosphodiesterase family protein [Saccharomonospora xinjiangensis]EID55429.1 putative AP superfamily protein [Saccharomonospora xinjiangensis XJ-54]